MYKVVDEYLDLSKGGPIFLFIGAEVSRYCRSLKIYEISDINLMS